MRSASFTKRPQLDLAGALEVRLTALQRDVRQRDLELEDLLRRNYALASRVAALRQLSNVVLPGTVRRPRWVSAPMRVPPLLDQSRRGRAGLDT